MTEDQRRRAAAAAAADAAMGVVEQTTGRHSANRADSAWIWFRAFAAAGGLVLNPKVWRVGEGAEEVVTELVSTALAGGIGVDRVFLLLHEKDRGLRALKDGYGEWQLAGLEQDAVKRVLIREIHRAYKAATRASIKHLRC